MAQNGRRSWNRTEKANRMIRNADNEISFRETYLDAFQRPRHSRATSRAEHFFSFRMLWSVVIIIDACDSRVSFIIKRSIYYWSRLIDNSAYEIMNNNGSLLMIPSPMTDVSIRRQASNKDINSRSKWVKSGGKNWIVLVRFGASHSRVKLSYIMNGNENDGTHY